MQDLPTVRTDARDRGATLVVFALASVVLLTLVAFAVDLGQARFSRRDNQQTVDLASLAAGYFMAGHASSGGVAETQPQAACKAAIYSVWTNADDFMATSTSTEVQAAAATACLVFPPTATACSETMASLSLLPPLTSGPYVLDIEWPVPDSRIADTRFDNGDAGVNDGDACDRMLIELDKVEDTAFAGVIGVNDLETTARAVVRGAPFLPDEGVAALVILEREGCGTLQTSGQGAVIVKSIVVDGNEQQGVVQSDSAGSTTSGGSLQCTSNPNAGGYAIYGTALPSGDPSIVAEGTSDADGIIATYAERVGGRAACCYPGGLNVKPGESGVTSRTPADGRFNPPGRPAISNLHLSGWSSTVTNGASITTPTPDTVLNRPGDCTPANGTDFTQTGTVIFACGANGFSVQNNRSINISGATTVKFIGGLSVGTGGSLTMPETATVIVSRASVTDEARLVVDGSASFPKANRFYVGGTPSTCNQVNNCSAVRVSGSLQVNHEGDTDCPSSTAGYGVLATFGGIIDVSGAVTWCELFVFVGRSESTYAPEQRISGGINCSPLKPCPLAATNNSRNRFVLDGGGSSVVWSAPDRTETPPDASNPYEGLALWVEGTGTSQIKGTGALETTGVFFLPNALFEFNGQATASNPKEAQFFTRTLNFSGLGDLNLTPDPNDAVPTPIPGDFGLIR